MNIHLTYESGQQYSERLGNFDVKVSRSGNRIKVSFRQKDSSGHGYASFSLPISKADQLGRAISTCTAADGVEPIQFSVEDAPAKAVAA
jgi:hypothetical protein